MAEATVAVEVMEAVVLEDMEEVAAVIVEVVMEEKAVKAVTVAEGVAVDEVVDEVCILVFFHGPLLIFFV